MPIRTLLDTTCLVAALCAWHEHHEATRTDLERRLRARERLVVAAPSLVESYAVLTRLPPPHRLSAHDAWRLLDGNWSGSDVVALSVSEYRRVIRDSRDNGVHGGRVYDAVIAACARKAGARTLVTWNLAHFHGLDASVDVVAPATE